MAIDSHMHINSIVLEKVKISDYINEIINNPDIESVINVGLNIDTSNESLLISKINSNFYSTIGIHPLYIESQNVESLYELGTCDRVVAIGEIGLDYYWNKENKEVQKWAFIKQIELANELKLPIVIHTRDAVADTISILKEYNVIKHGLFHCCPQNIELVKEGLKLGFYISCAGPYTFKSAKNSEDIIKLIPDDKILIETDSPYLAPEPKRGTRNDSRNVKYIAEKIAKAKEKDLETVAQMTYKNACQIFEI